MPRVMKKRAALGTTIQSKPGFCPNCDGRRIIKHGLRKNTHRQLQVYLCRDCGKFFSSLVGIKGVKYPPRVIARALCLYHLGHTQEEVAKRLDSDHRLTVPRRTIADWLACYRPITTLYRLREASTEKFGKAMLKGRKLEHQQVYEFKMHLAKLDFLADAVPADVAAKVKNYLFSILEGFPDGLFQEDKTANLDQATLAEGSAQRPESIRSSKSEFELLPFCRVQKENLANDLAALGLLLARKSRDRHPSVQDFMLANDSSTIACEVPIYLEADEIRYYKSKGFFVTLPESSKPITGHIDVIQARNGLIHILDYKPDARHIDPVNQLVVYALGLASRTRLPVKAFKCAWFDEKDYFEFFPLQAIQAKRAPRRPETL